MNNVKKLIWGDTFMYALCFTGGYTVGMLSLGFDNINTINWIFAIVMLALVLLMNVYFSFKEYKQGKPAVNSSKWITVVGVALFMVIAVIEYFAQNDNGDLKFPVTAFIIGTAATAVVMAIYTCLTKKIRNSISA